MAQPHGLDDGAAEPSPSQFAYPPLERGMELPAGVHGWARPEFRGVVRVFALAFTRYRVGGGGICVYMDGEPVLDLWAGTAQKGHEWTRDTAGNIFSASKGVTATIIHRLVDRGLLEYHQPVARYWPEFAANGKGAITVDEILSHTAGLSRLTGVAHNYEEMFDPDLMADRLAAAPVDRYFGKPAYHALSIGWLMGRLAKAVTGKDLEELYRTELAETLGVDGIYLGRPPADAPSESAALTPYLDRVARTGFIRRTAPPVMGMLDKIPGVKGAASTLYQPGAEMLLADDGHASAAVMDLRCGAGSGCCTAPALAKLYSALAGDGSVGGIRLLSPEVTKGLGRKNSYRIDHSLGLPMGWHRGYHSLPIPVIGGGFGHIGLGGSFGWADQKRKISVAVVHNRLPSTMVFDQTIIGTFLPSIVRAAR
ncbi:beta-lactamase family protein [Mycobacterium sp. CBMA271]|uniref:serine hydrolase domain-containing protein n=1 Tax=unclassified Mycobacteroides TaxID=2618759 RepID=UPI0012DDB2D3|nr:MULTISPECIES: serine hydrolase domain-containing protein [unclassified Mycobacteroides]MUM16565.1 esterase [Mycobacteroides sp. CBMA 326]MUM22128.1 beta-lactamase family protein [Mycobacteroides sp. CBMA 271]